MKKTFVLMTALAICGASVKAQQISLGVKAGIQQNNFTLREKGGSENRMQMGGIGFHAGVMAEAALHSNFAVQPQLLFVSRSVQQSKNSKINLYAIDLPVNFVYKQGGFFAGIGPNFSYGISAKSKSGSYSENLYSENVEGSPLKRFELGANALLGYKFNNGLLLSANYTKGLSNLVKENASDIKYSTGFASFSIGYILASKQK